MIDVKEATALAIEYFNKIPGYKDRAKSAVVEEVELNEDEKYWYVTLSYSEPVTATPSPFDILGKTVKYYKIYKIFKIDANSGKVYSMKIRKL